MALITFPEAPFAVPSDLSWGAGAAPTLTESIFGGLADDEVGWVFPTPKAGEVAKIGILIGPTVNAVGDGLRVALTNVNTNGEPSTDLETNTFGTIAVPVASTWYWVTLTATGTVQKHQYVGVRVRSAGASPYDGGVIGVVNASTNRGTPYFRSYLSAVEARSGAQGCEAIEYDDGSRPYIFTLPVSSLATVSFNNASVPNIRGTRFKHPLGLRCIGAMVKTNATATTYEVALYDNTMPTDDLSVGRLTRVTGIDTEHRALRAGQFVPWPVAQALVKNGIYRVMLIPEAATSIDSFELLVDSAGTMAAHPEGVEVYLETRDVAASPDVWTATTMRRTISVMPVFDGWDSEA